MEEHKKHIGKPCYLKFGTFHGMTGTVQSVIHVNGADRYLVKLSNGKTIPKKVTNVIIFGGVQSSDYHSKKRYRL